MNGENRNVEVSTNGSHAMADANSLEEEVRATASPNKQSIEQRLAALRETIRSWDWRAAPVEAGALPASGTVTTVAALKTSAPPSEACEDWVQVRPDPGAESEGQNDQSPVATDQPPPMVTDPLTESEDPEAVLDRVGAGPASTSLPTDQPESISANSDSAPGTDKPGRGNVDTRRIAVYSSVGDQREPVSENVDYPPVAALVSPPELVADKNDVPPAAASGPKHGARDPLSRLWAHRWTKPVALCLVLFLALLVGAWALGLTHDTSDSGSPATTNVTQPTTVQAGARLSTSTTVAGPLAAAQLTQYEQYATALEKANGTAATGLGGLGNPPTLTQVTPVITPYLQAVKVYNLQFHSVQWPASMQVDVAADEAQLTAFINYLQTVGSGDPTNMDTWLSQLHIQGAATQTSDNKIRKDLGLPVSSSYP